MDGYMDYTPVIIILLLAAIVGSAIEIIAKAEGDSPEYTRKAQVVLILVFCTPMLYRLFTTKSKKKVE